MWIVALALRRPYTFVVMALLIIILTPLVVYRTPTDIFPDINIPVISVVWNYSGLAPKDMADRVVTVSERGITITVNDIEHIESQSLNGVGVIKIFFRPGTNIQLALSQVTAIVQTATRQLPPGTTPPLVITYTASSTPIIQLGLSSKTLPEQELFDLGNSFLRSQLATVQGASLPFPYGGKQRQIQVDLDLPKLQSYGLAPVDIVNAVNAQNLVLPSGTTKIGPLEYPVEMNGTPETIDELNVLPMSWSAGPMLPQPNAPWRRKTRWWEWRLRRSILILSLTGSGGLQSRAITSLVSAPSAFWAVGSDLLQPVLNGGRNRANLAAAKSSYNASVADYRQSVLTAFQKVEDGLSGLNALSQASTAQNAAVEDARRALELANNRYVGGVPHTWTSSRRKPLCSPMNGWPLNCWASRWLLPCF